MAGRHSPTLVIGYDGSEAAQHALGRIQRWASPEASLIIVAVTPSVASPGLGAELADERLEAEAALQEASELLRDAGQLGPIETRTATGDPAEVLMQIVREVDADLLVVGRRGRDFLSRALLGSVAERVVRSAPCDVLVVG